ncbi:MAG: hypothetical protein AB8B73_07645 [Ekhidna sp.]
MKKHIKTWSIRVISFGLVSFLSIILAVLNPSLLYANKTDFGSYTVYHHSKLPAEFESRLANVDQLVKQSELFDPSFNTKICLNDGSFYPRILETFRGTAFGWGFFNTAVFNGEFDFEKNTVQLNGYNWNLEHLMTHELVHCMQSNALGLLKSSPIKNNPHWMWEGYPEYVSRQNEDQLSLVDNIERFELAKANDPDEWGIFFNDETVSPRSYYEARLLVQYCLEVKQMSYLNLLNSSLAKTTIEQEMNDWYVGQARNGKAGF